jgi:hypothetical protein
VGSGVGVTLVAVGMTTVAVGMGTGVARREHEASSNVSASKYFFIQNIIVLGGL